MRKIPELFTDQRGLTPMHQVGALLSALFKDSDLSTSYLKWRRSTISSSLSCSVSQPSTHILHSCQHLTPNQLVRMILQVFGGVPEPFEVFHCRPTVTEEDLRLFLNPKRATKRPFLKLILEVNKLPYQLQEVSHTSSSTDLVLPDTESLIINHHYLPCREALVLQGTKSSLQLY